MSGYKFEIDQAKCISRFSPRYEKAQKYVDSEVLRCSAPFVPFREGTLMKSGTLGTVVGSGVVKYNAPYAGRVYYGTGMNFNKNHHPQACAQWFEKSKAAYKEDWIKGAQNIISGDG